MGKSSPSQTTTTTNPRIPPELKPLIESTVGRWLAFQNSAWNKFMPGVGPPGEDPFAQDWRLPASVRADYRTKDQDPTVQQG